MKDLKSVFLVKKCAEDFTDIFERYFKEIGLPLCNHLRMGDNTLKVECQTALFRFVDKDDLLLELSLDV